MENEKVITAIQEAELVLVGIGGEMEADLSKMPENRKYADFIKRVENNSSYSWMIPFLEKIYLEENKNERIVKAYAALAALLENKNYFIISTCMDDYIYSTDLNKERIVTPCGGYLLEQCAANCCDQVWRADGDMLDNVRRCLHYEENPEELVKPVCSNCNEAIVFNNKNAKNYAEAGYQRQWNTYKKWLQGTVNKRLCVLELGVGMGYPTVIRWPFEKIVFFNHKANLFRVHSKLYQITEEIKDKSCSIKQNPIEFLNK